MSGAYSITLGTISSGWSFVGVGRTATKRGRFSQGVVLRSVTLSQASSQSVTARAVVYANGVLVAQGPSTNASNTTALELSITATLAPGTNYDIGVYVTAGGIYAMPAASIRTINSSPAFCTWTDAETAIRYADGAAAPTTSQADKTLTLALGFDPSNQSPNAPILTAPADGAGIDRNSTNRFGWDFSDPDAGDSQSKFDLRYRVTGTSTWTNVSGTTPNTYLDAPAGTFAAGDYEWQVRTYDAQGAVGPYSSSAFFTAADAPAMPTITSPVNGGTFAQSQVVEWSTPVQDSYQIQVRDTGDAVQYDSGEVTSQTARSAQVPFPDNGTTRKLRIRVKDGGLWSPWYEITGTVSWLAPPAATGALTPDTLTGSLLVIITNPAPGAGEPAAAYNTVEVDDGDGKGFKARYGSQMLPTNTPWRYMLPRSGRDYTGAVKIITVADNGVSVETIV